MRVLNYRLSILLQFVIFAFEFSSLDDQYDHLNFLEVEKNFSDFSELTVESNLENSIKTNDPGQENNFLNSKAKEFLEESMTGLDYHIKQIKPQSNFTSKNPLNITSFDTWDDMAALGLWVGLFVIFGPTAIAVLVLYICCKNVCLRDNPSRLLA